MTGRSAGMATCQIPVRVDAATMPRSDELPESIARLARHQAVVLTDEGWRHDVGRLLQTLEKVALSPAPPSTSSEPGPDGRRTAERAQKPSQDEQRGQRQE